MNEIGIIIVTYNSAAEIGECLDAALASGGDIVVVDNASTDGTAGEVVRRGVRFLANAENRGFAAAVNQGFAVLNNPYVLLLNPDAVVQTSLEPLRQACDIPGCAGAGGQLVGQNGQPQVGFMVRALPTPATLALEALLLNRIWPANPVNRRYRCRGWDCSLRSRVEQPAGAFFMVRRAVWEELGGFDEDFRPLWFEDVDFCRRIRDRGFSLFYIPEAVAKHTGGHSVPGLPLEMRLIYWYRGLLRYSAKHFHPFAFRAVCLAVVTGSFLRGLAESALNCSFKPMAAYGKVASLATRYLFYGS
jgi:N-acetylglucosaminyl-diphospho-decaprenol L-rhamnosyltransferase